MHAGKGNFITRDVGRIIESESEKCSTVRESGARRFLEKCSTTYPGGIGDCVEIPVHGWTLGVLGRRP
jgi:hypothetical protein